MAFIKTAYSAVLLAAFAALASSQARASCYQYYDAKDRKICELEERIEEVSREHRRSLDEANEKQQKQLEEIKRQMDLDYIYGFPGQRTWSYDR